MSIIVNEDSILCIGLQPIQPVDDLMGSDKVAGFAAASIQCLSISQRLRGDDTGCVIDGFHESEVDFTVLGKLTEVCFHQTLCSVDGISDASIVPEQNEQGVYLFGAGSGVSIGCFLVSI